MHGLASINKINQEATEAARILREQSQDETLSPERRAVAAETLGYVEASGADKVVL